MDDNNLSTCYKVIQFITASPLRGKPTNIRLCQRWRLQFVWVGVCWLNWSGPRLSHVEDSWYMNPDTQWGTMCSCLLVLVRTKNCCGSLSGSWFLVSSSIFVSLCCYLRFEEAMLAAWLMIRNWNGSTDWSLISSDVTGQECSSCRQNRMWIHECAAVVVVVVVSHVIQMTQLMVQTCIKILFIIYLIGPKSPLLIWTPFHNIWNFLIEHEAFKTDVLIHLQRIDWWKSPLLFILISLLPSERKWSLCFLFLSSCSLLQSAWQPGCSSGTFRTSSSPSDFTRPPVYSNVRLLNARFLWRNPSVLSAAITDCSSQRLMEQNVKHRYYWYDSASSEQSVLV